MRKFCFIASLFYLRYFSKQNNMKWPFEKFVSIDFPQQTRTKSTNIRSVRPLFNGKL